MLDFNKITPQVLVDNLIRRANLLVKDGVNTNFDELFGDYVTYAKTKEVECVFKLVDLETLQAGCVDEKQIEIFVHNLFLAFRLYKSFLNFLQLANENSNKMAQQIGEIRRKAEEVSPQIQQEAELIKQEALLLKDYTEGFYNKFLQLVIGLPNILLPEVPFGLGSEQNVEKSCYDSVRGFVDRQGFEIKSHYAVLDKLMDFESARALSGSRFVFLHGDLALLERAIANFMLDTHVLQHGYREVSVPLLVKGSTMYNTGQLPKFEEDLYKLENSDLWLIPTAEVPLTALVYDRIIKNQELPLRYTAHTPCFRAEAGSAGRDTQGMIRMHQFLKVELVTLCSPERSEEEHAYMLNAAESIYRALDLPYRVMLLCSQDTGMNSGKTYDLEVWMPFQKTYREISSVSNCLDFQTRRLRARYRDEGRNTHLLHSLNGSGAAVGRTLVAILENYQNPDGSVSVPDALLKYTHGVSKIFNC